MITNVNDNERVKLLKDTSQGVAGTPATVTSLNVTPDGGKSLKLDFGSVERLVPTPTPTPTPTVTAEIRLSNGHVLDGTMPDGIAYLNDTVKLFGNFPLNPFVEWININPDTSESPPRSDHDVDYIITVLDDGEKLYAKVYDRQGGTLLCKTDVITLADGPEPGPTPDPGPEPTPTPTPTPTPDPTPVPVPPPPTGVTMFKAPFPTSHWYRKATGKVLVNDARAAAVHAGGAYINSNNGFGIHVHQALASDPSRTIVTPQGTVTIKVPASATAEAGSDGNLCICDPSMSYIDDFWIYNGTNSARRWVRAPTSGNGATGGVRAAGWCTAGGLIRDWELRAGRIDHALVIVIPWSDAKKGYVSPAVSEDAYASTDYAGPVPLGTQFVIPPSVDVTAQGWSAGGVMLARALQEFGCYAGDTSYKGNGPSSTKVFVAEPMSAGTSQLNGMLANITAIKSHLLAA